MKRGPLRLSLPLPPVNTSAYMQARYRIPIARATAGNLVLVEGIDATISKTATVVSDALDSEMHIFRWARHALSWEGGSRCCWAALVALHLPATV